MILKCDCQNEFQDKMYGKNKRVFNEMKAEGSWRCANCGKVLQGIKKKLTIDEDKK